MEPTDSSSTTDDTIEEIVINPSNHQTNTLPQDAKNPSTISNTELGFKTSIQTRIGIVNPLQLEAKVVEPHPASKASGTTNTSMTATGRSRGELGSGFQDIWGGFKGTAAPSYTKLKHLALFHSDIYASAHGRHDQYTIRQILLEHILERGGLFVKEVRSGSGDTICWKLRSHNSVTETVAMMLRTFSTNRSTSKRVVDDLFQLSAGFPTVEDLNDWKELRAQILTRIQFSGPSESPALAMYYNPKTNPAPNDAEREDQHRGQESPPRSPRASASRCVSLNHHDNEPLPPVCNTRPLAEIQVKVTVIQEQIDAPHDQCPLVATVTPTFFEAGNKVQVEIKTPIHPHRTAQSELPPAVLRPSTGPRRVSLDLTHPNSETDRSRERPTSPTSQGYGHRLQNNLSHEISTVVRLDENSSIADRPSDNPSHGDQRPESNAVLTAVSKGPQPNSSGNPGGHGAEALGTVTTPWRDANNGKHHRRPLPGFNVLNVGLSGERSAISLDAEPCTFEAANLHAMRFDGGKRMKHGEYPIARDQGGTINTAPTIGITDTMVDHLVDRATEHRRMLQEGESHIDSQRSAKASTLMGATEQHGSVETQKATSIDLPVKTGICHDVSTPTKKRKWPERNPFPAVFWDIDGNKITPGDDDDDDIFHALASFDDRDGLNAWIVTSPNQAVDVVTDASSSVATSMHAMDDHPIDLFNYEIWQSLLPSSFSEDIY